MNINKLSKETGIPVSTLRYYEKVGLIRDIKRDENNYRIYDFQHVKCLNVIKKLRESNISIEMLQQIDNAYWNNEIKEDQIKEVLKLAIVEKRTIQNSINREIEILTEMINNKDEFFKN